MNDEAAAKKLAEALEASLHQRGAPLMSRDLEAQIASDLLPAVRVLLGDELREAAKEFSRLSVLGQRLLKRADELAGVCHICAVLRQECVHRGAERSVDSHDALVNGRPSAPPSSSRSDAKPTCTAQYHFECGFFEGHTGEHMDLEGLWRW